MEDTLINFETAKLAKEKGVKLDINGLYWEDGSYDSGENALVYEEFQDVMSAPTQSLLQKWLREVHNIYVESYHDLTSDGTKIQFYTSWGFLQQKDKNGNRNVNGWYDEYNDWKTYEEALEIGLQEALKLI